VGEPLREQAKPHCLAGDVCHVHGRAR
jgi:hypothetical protein